MGRPGGSVLLLGAPLDSPRGKIRSTTSGINARRPCLRRGYLWSLQLDPTGTVRKSRIQRRLFAHKLTFAAAMLEWTLSTRSRHSTYLQSRSGLAVSCSALLASSTALTRLVRRPDGPICPTRIRLFRERRIEIGPSEKPEFIVRCTLSRVSKDNFRSLR